VATVKPEPRTVRLTNRDGMLRPLDSIVDDVLNIALAHCDGKKLHAAKQLSIARSTFYRKFKAGA
jgi:transcriptional regulator of acetoin/glycerol metabolism